MDERALLEHLDRGTPWADDERAALPTDLDGATRRALALRALRVARGERVVGYKIGFTNRTIWQRYRVHAPIWGPVYDTGLVHCDGHATIDLAGTCEPRLEPECVFGIARTPPPNATLDDAFACVDWYAPGFEIVQSHAPGWRFTAAETIADGALHARLAIGPTRPVRAVADDAEAFDARLAATRVRLFEGDVKRDSGTGANVLDGPLHALLHFLQALDRVPDAPRLAAGDVVTTGTWTDAWPLRAGQTWRAAFDAPLVPLSITLA